MNHLMGDICDKPKVLTQDTILYLEKLRMYWISHRNWQQKSNETGIA